MSAERRSISDRVMAWLEERFPVGTVLEVIRHKTVPVHRHTIWYYMGGMTLFLFVVQVVTGILLLLYYRPSPDSAFESVQFIMTEVRFGWLVRSIHSWCGNLLIFVLLVHMFSVFFLKAYRRPRELTWFSGAALLLLMLGFGFTGYLLPWNQLSFFATKVGSVIAGSMPLVGDFALRFLRGGANVTGGTLTRFFGWHVAILPLITTVVLTVHVVFVQIQGMSIPEDVRRKASGEEKVPKMAFFWNFLLGDVLGWVIALGLLAALSAYYPWELGVKADAFASAPEGIRPEWYFLFMYEALKYIPARVFGLEGEMLGILGFIAAGAVWFFIPLIDRKASTKISTVATWCGLVALIFIIIMTLLAYV